MRQGISRIARRFSVRSLVIVASVGAACSVAHSDAYVARRNISGIERIAAIAGPVGFQLSMANAGFQYSPSIFTLLQTEIRTFSKNASITSTVDPVTTGGVPRSFFGTVAVPFSAIGVKGQWDRVRGQTLPNPGNCKSTACKSRVMRFNDAVSNGKDKDFASKLAIANNAANGLIGYQSDRAIYGTLDHWASAKETIQRGVGDCEDFAILKQTLLRAMGVPDKSLSIIILRDNSRNLYHAVLGVSTNQGHLILDNVRGQVYRDTQAANYQPLFSFSGSRSWIHGTPAGRSELTAKAQIPFDSVAPGEIAAMPAMSVSAEPLDLAQLRPSLQY